MIFIEHLHFDHQIVMFVFKRWVNMACKKYLTALICYLYLKIPSEVVLLAQGSV